MSSGGDATRRDRMTGAFQGVPIERYGAVKAGQKASLGSARALAVPRTVPRFHPRG